MNEKILTQTQRAALKADENLTAPLVRIVVPLAAAGSAGDSRPVRVLGKFVTITESTGEFSLGFDSNNPVPMDFGLTLESPGESLFRELLLTNLSSAANRVVLYVGFIRVTNDRLNVLPGAEGTPASFIPSIWDRHVVTFDGVTNVGGTWVELAPADPNRERILIADPGAAAYWSADEVAMPETDSLNDINQRANLEGLLILKTRAAIMVNAANGVTIRALSSQF